MQPGPMVRKQAFCSRPGKSYPPPHPPSFTQPYLKNLTRQRPSERIKRPDFEMSFAPVGSLGDVIALINIVKELITAFDKRRGSSAEYQDILRKLWAFNRVLKEVETLCRSITTTAEATTSRDAMLCVVGQARTSIEALSKGIRKFEPSLRQGGSQSSLKDAARKAEWKLFHSDDSAKIQSEIDMYCSILSVLVTTVNE